MSEHKPFDPAPPPIGATVRLNAEATRRLDGSPGRGRSKALIGTVKGYTAGRCTVEWQSAKWPTEQIHKRYLEVVT